MVWDIGIWRIKMKLRNKVFAINFSITLVIILVISSLIVIIVDDYNRYTIYQYLLNQSNSSQAYLSEYFSSTDANQHNLLLVRNREILEERLSRQLSCPVTIKSSLEEMDRPEEQRALEGIKAYYVERNREKSIFHLSFPINLNDNIIGVGSYHYPLYEIDRMKGQLVVFLTIVALLSSILVFLLSYGLSIRIIKPLEKLIMLTRQYSKGNFKKVDPIKTGDEIEELALSFEKMGVEIESTITSLKEEQAKQKRFMDNVTHEIRTPLTNIIGYADLIPRIGNEEQRNNYLAHIHSEGNRLLNMVENLLELSRLKQYSFSIDKRDEDLKPLIDKVIELMTPRATKMGFLLEHDINSVKAFVDGDKIKQVIINILDNAIKHSDGDTIKVKLWENEDVNIEISDNGKGIPGEDIENITQPFIRVDKSRSKKMGGAGLGLAICKEIIEMHDGSFKIESEIHKGTVVTISLQP